MMSARSGREAEFQPELARRVGGYLGVVREPSGRHSHRKRGQSLWLDLGEAKDIAEVSVNGQLAGHAWHAPSRIDISHAATPSRNTVSICVANLWVNRLIGDQQPGARKITWTALATYTRNARLEYP